ncbi:hypothetical protein P691DRAFT_333415 [Macrolepiota fuliginosa MF-IS2]|uniref:Uncharacterized protein n=1 Tax=Macrolepiota fuliginosa MF-IS2 TaxID=1400762 RepID=A0A9P6BYS5_9AGAR|nr:hypothetical protein P691DRAFT_333415 [Macrolepiota fuliginosa MF-IS2]
MGVYRAWSASLGLLLLLLGSQGLGATTYRYCHLTTTKMRPVLPCQISRDVFYQAEIKAIGKTWLQYPNDRNVQQMYFSKKNGFVGVGRRN